MTSLLLKNKFIAPDPKNAIQAKQMESLATKLCGLFAINMYASYEIYDDANVACVDISY